MISLPDFYSTTCTDPPPTINLGFVREHEDSPDSAHTSLDFIIYYLFRSRYRADPLSSEYGITSLSRRLLNWQSDNGFVAIPRTDDWRVSSHIHLHATQDSAPICQR